MSASPEQEEPGRRRELATVYEVARYLRVGSSTVHRWTTEGKLRAYGGPRYRRWDLDEVDEFMGIPRR